MKNPIFDPYEDVLLCPLCGGMYLHAEIMKSFKKNDVCTVEFSCEICHGEPTLHLVQHKGRTFLVWGDGEGGAVWDAASSSETE